MVVARQGDKTLLVFNRQKRYWELPGGMIDEGETPRACAARELFEETALQCAERELVFLAALRFQLRSRTPGDTFREEFGAIDRWLACSSWR
jgi:8-oxo-dGTP diphosphatase